jgi:two-component system, cell cycle sensor histidine kinase and response regulator CckA
MSDGYDHTLRRILLVEDEASDALILSNALERLGVPPHALEHATTLADALRRLEGDPPQLGIIDLGLPDSQGTDTVRHLRDAAPALPLIVVSAAADTTAALRSLQQGADDYLVKGDYDSHALDRAIRYARERRRLQSAERRRATEVERAERQLRAVVEANGDGMLIVDDAGVVCFANERARLLLGVVGSDIEGIVLGSPLLKPGGTVELEGPSIGGARARLEMRTTPIDWEQTAATLIVLRDVTTHRLLEERLQQSQKMEALGKLTGGIAHDFNNVLTVILNGAEILAETVPKEFDEAHAELREIETSARRAAGMVRRLLGFSRRGYLRFETVDVRQFTEDALSIMRRMVTNDVSIRSSVEAGLGNVRADPAALQQIFLNVVANARDAMPGGGEFSVEVRPVDLDESHRERYPWVLPGRYERVSLTDTGVGMTEETLARIFEPFFTTKGPESGTGLGMAMVYGLMKQHRGLVHVHSRPGRGTRVELFFPSSSASGRTGSEPAPTRADAPRNQGTILVIEDEPALRRGMERVLTSAGYQVLLAQDGREGIESYRRDPARIDLVVSDLVMPRLGGREVLAEVRGSGDPCPFLLITGYGADSLAELRGRGVSMLTKPWTQRDLLEAVRDAMGGHDVAPEATA